MRKLFEKHGASLGEAGTVRLFLQGRVGRADPPGGARRGQGHGADDGGRRRRLRRGRRLLGASAGRRSSSSRSRKALEKAGIKPTSAGHRAAPDRDDAGQDTEVAQRLIAFLEALEDHDDVQNVYTNAELPDGL